jgi:hypothetical protein
MNKIVNITHYVNRLEGAAPARRPVAAASGTWSEAAARTERTRGVLLQFPSPFQGPLNAA